MGAKILVVDDELQMRKALGAVLKRKGYEVRSAHCVRQALSAIDAEDFDAVITDLRMPDKSGIDLLKSIRGVKPNIPVLIMTAYGTIENAITAMKLGACDYILKPFSSAILESALNKALISGRDERGERPLKARSKVMTDMLEIARSIAPTPATVLISGESGTGKELLARFIRDCSDRADKPFVSLNCASIPDGLLESELFGHEKGAFTGATSRRIGKFEQADEGTLLLDEIGEMGLDLQVKLLRALQEREIDRVGGKGAIKVNIRVIATTNRDLREEVDSGRFREDLFYRLNVFPFTIAPLRERPEDIELLGSFFLKSFSKKYSKPLVSIDKNAMKSLELNPWKGNVRELENVIERAVLMSRGRELTCEDLYYGEVTPLGPARTAARPAHGDHHDGTIKEMEKELILKAMGDTDGNKNNAAKKLGISIRTLRNKLKEYSKVEEVSL